MAENKLPLNDFMRADFAKSGISEATINEYVQGGYLTSESDHWQLFYPELLENKKSSYYTKRLKNPTDKSKYIRPKGETSRLFRPLDFTPENLQRPDSYVIITEGEKKAIKAVQEGFNCLSVAGVWCWKGKTPDGLIPDLHKINWKNKRVYLCFDNDIHLKPQVRRALLAFAEQLQEFGATVLNIELPKFKEKNND